ncbi:unnamed protein product [Larinioides sclopetarius]|uniref:Uncharacterized protein n=1 Tax=Larinioides sclopetarius TaxID=280406 RepID=A0AAV2B1R8_9ARAC
MLSSCFFRIVNFQYKEGPCKCLCPSHLKQWDVTLDIEAMLKWEINNLVTTAKPAKSNPSPTKASQVVIISTRKLKLLTHLEPPSTDRTEDASQRAHFLVTSHHLLRIQLSDGTEDATPRDASSLTYQVTSHQPTHRAPLPPYGTRRDIPEIILS